MNISYMEVIGFNHPTVACKLEGINVGYDDLIHVSGDSIPAKATLDAEIVVETKVRMWRLIQVERDRRTQAGVKVGANWFHSDQPSRIQQLGLVIMGAGLPPGIMWKTMDGNFVEMTQTLAGQIFQSIAGKDQAIYTAAEQHKGQMLAASDPAAYNYLTGSPTWPLVYGE